MHLGFVSIGRPLKGTPSPLHRHSFEIENNLEETIFKLLAPVSEQFELTELPAALVSNVTKEALPN